MDIAKVTNSEFKSGTLEDALEEADIFIGVSAPGVLKTEWISKMVERPVIFAMANPIPEIYPDEALLEAGAYIVGTAAVIFITKLIISLLSQVFLGVH
ncbi:NAD-dependent malic enzyme [Streptococcus dysgalactiae subsp. dysgalactiae]|uniref:NAD-dependent malic enzyme n=1 Tax=Streptococcus dysgalactiae subsp. dysgalactiae TaxID=99822 RepID=A0A380JTQ1_STRDY|nr:NAD-dependent malic enzyme [Streptococcus dysgalactiae subsp. dysgalactiae]